ncbi:Protein SEY1 [Spathaspora sp. JA1]|nr:Protein SEY1 [Spathaspora sp. JA1]
MSTDHTTEDTLEAPLSQTSSSSSFVPISPNLSSGIQDAIQIVDEHKQFNPSILNYVNATTGNISGSGNNYHIISVFGSQSTGKSTLLNRLFHTNFDVMDETQRRQQTTKGIWMAHSPRVTTTHDQQQQQQHHPLGSNIYVMDVEGTDGREHGEDKDFERKAALFAIATSEILIINIWETQVGLYQGANLGLLKTVFEVNLSLFGKSKLDKNQNNYNHRILLLIVIRDYAGMTPVENLAETVTDDLNKMWNELAKPHDLTELKFSDFFDIDFHTLNHKIFQPQEFSQGIAKLGDRLVVKDELFKPEYHHNIPIDGWTMYAENCWERIENNKDLDLPMEQILVAKFRCTEIIKEVVDEFKGKFDEIFKADSSFSDFKELGNLMNDLHEDTTENFDQSASRYNKSVYEEKKLELNEKLFGQYKQLFEKQSQRLINDTLAKFKVDLVGLKGKDFKSKSQELSKQARELISTSLESISLKGEIPIEDSISSFDLDIDNTISKQQVVELNSIVNKTLKKLTTGISKAVQQELVNPDEETWDRVFEKFKQLSTLSEYDLGTTSEQNKTAEETFEFKSWTQFHQILCKLISKEKLLIILQDRFDDKFRYDENGIPKLYFNEHDLEESFQISKRHAVSIMPILSLAKLSNDTEILPDVDIFDQELRRKYLGVEDHDDEEEELEEEQKCFAGVLSEVEKAEVLSKFKKEIDAKFMENKRAIVQHVTQIPYYIYLIILVLGWNEFMAVLRNPMFFALCLVFGSALYIMYTMNLLKPAMIVSQRMFDEAILIAKEKLKQVLIDDHEVNARRGIRNDQIKEEQGEEIELADLSKD